MDKYTFTLLSLISIFMFLYCCDAPIWSHRLWFLVNHKNEGDLLYNIGVSFIAAYIFYILQVFIPEKKKELTQIPLRAAVQKDVQYFTVSIVHMWVDYYEYVKNEGLKGMPNKSIDSIFEQKIMYKIIDNIKLDAIQDKKMPLGKNTWYYYTKQHLCEICAWGERILAYRASELPPDIYYAIFYLTTEGGIVSTMNRVFELFEKFEEVRGCYSTVGALLPANAKGQLFDLSMDIKAVKALVNWVNDEYKYLQQQDVFVLANIKKIEVN